MRSRVPFALLALATIALGVGVRSFATGWFAKYAGIALYAVLIYWLVLAVAPRLVRARAALIALAICFAIELLQLTRVPAAINDVVPQARWVLGEVFSPWDLVGYVLGIGGIAAAHAITSRRENRACQAEGL